MNLSDRVGAAILAIGLGLPGAIWLPLVMFADSGTHGAIVLGISLSLVMVVLAPAIVVGYAIPTRWRWGALVGWGGEIVPVFMVLSLLIALIASHDAIRPDLDAGALAATITFLVLTAVAFPLAGLLGGWLGFQIRHRRSRNTL